MIAVITATMIRMLTCFILMLPTFVSGGCATDSSGRMLNISSVMFYEINNNNQNVFGGRHLSSRGSTPMLSTSSIISINTLILFIIIIIIISIFMIIPLIKGINTNALDIINSLLAQSSLLLRFTQCLVMIMMKMMMIVTIYDKDDRCYKCDSTCCPDSGNASG